MKFKTELVKGKLIKRYKRFLADVELESGEIVTAHCANSGSMLTCLEEGAPVALTFVDDPKRKTKYSWEMIFVNNNWVGINTSHPNKIIFDAIVNQQIVGLDMYDEVKREVKFDESRLDIVAKNSEETCVIEVKNVTMMVDNVALFPDAKTSRGLKHLNTLIRLKSEGYRAVMVYLVQRSDVESFTVAKDIDKDYAEGLKKAVENGVEVFVLRATVSPSEIKIDKRLNFFL